VQYTYAFTSGRRAGASFDPSLSAMGNELTRFRPNYRSMKLPSMPVKSSGPHADAGGPEAYGEVTRENARDKSRPLR